MGHGVPGTGHTGGPASRVPRPVQGPARVRVGFDEPDNFIALQEIQPWLVSLCQAVEDHGSQALIISHHPIPAGEGSGEACVREQYPSR